MADCSGSAADIQIWSLFMVVMGLLDAPIQYVNNTLCVWSTSSGRLPLGLCNSYGPDPRRCGTKHFRIGCQAGFTCQRNLVIQCYV